MPDFSGLFFVQTVLVYRPEEKNGSRFRANGPHLKIEIWGTRCNGDRSCDGRRLARVLELRPDS